jgi:hypothetical protein
MFHDLDFYSSPADALGILDSNSSQAKSETVRAEGVGGNKAGAIP